MRATLAIDARAQIAESPVWDAARQRLIWIDHAAGSIHEVRSDSMEARATRDGNADGWHISKHWSLERPIAAAIPRARGGFIVASGTEFLFMTDAGEVTPFARLEADGERVMLNDAKCDPQGGLWATTLSKDFRSAEGGLYLLDANGTVRQILGGARLGNGLAWSPDGSIFYFIDSVKLTVDAFDVDSSAASLGNRRTVVTVSPGRGVPNGMAVDREGRLWVALTGGGIVQCYAPDGAELDSVHIATPGVTSCAFGGCDGTDLWITSRSGRLPDIALELGLAPPMLESSGAHAGGLFICRPGASASPAVAFAG